ncbi:MAG: hypothetical protein RLZZ347_357 [Candidatus Parcubacteria bacterium]|jgi:hypothetical protein
MGLWNWLFGGTPPKKTDPQTEEAHLRDELMRTTSLSDCLTIYRQALPASELETAASSKIAKLAITFVNWETVARFLTPKDTLFLKAVESMFQLAGTCPQMEIVARLCPPEIAVRTKALEKLAEKAKSFDEWLVIFSLALPDSDLSRRAEAEVERQATTLKQWEEIWNNTSDPVLENKALEMRLAKSSTLAELSAVYTDAPEGSPIEAQVEDRFRATTASFDDLLAFYQNGDEDGNRWESLLEIVLSWLLAKAKDQDELLSVYEVCADGDDQDDGKLVLEEMGKRPFTKAIWDEIRKNADNGSSLESYAIRKLVTFAEDVNDLLALYLDCLENDDTDSDVLTELMEAVLSKATRREIQIIALLTDNELSLGDLGVLAQNKLDQQAPPAPPVAPPVPPTPAT